MTPPTRPSAAVISVCISCRPPDGGTPPEPGTPSEAEGLPGEALLARLRQAEARGDLPGVAIRPVQCLSVCKRPCTASLSGPGRYTYVFGDLDPEGGADALAACARLFVEAEHGYLLWRERPEPLRRGVVARIPPASWSSEDGRHPR